ncbi:MAG TPA: hypothetical protein VFF02_16040, partial [Anaeromyxobacteraceae bacterium]|nr:hypothetical protein [Anaeromyxobacteraceae bacterium]
MATYSPDEIRAALANAKAAGDAEAVATLEAALSAPAAAGPEPTQARAVERGAEQFLAWGFAPEVRGLAAAARSVTLPEATALGAEAEKLRGRELAFQARGGTFGPMQGEWPHFTPPETSDLMRRQRGAYEAEVGREEALGRELASRYPVEYYGPQVAGLAMALLRGGFKALAPAFARRAETKVLQAAKNPAGVGQLAEEALGAPAAAAREVLAQGVPLKSPRITYEALAPLARSVGQEVENIAAAAGRRGAAFDVRNVYRQVAQSTQEMAREPLVRKYVDDALAYIQQSAASRGKPGAVAFMEPSEAHRWRKALDDVLYGMANQLDPTGKVTAQARLAVRRAVS